MMKRKPNIFLIIISFVFVYSNSFGQSNTLYFMDGIHQSSQLNPAYQPSCNGYLALPALSDINFNFANTGFDFNDFIHNGTGDLKDSLVMDFNNLRSKLGKSNYLLFGTDVPIIGFGFWLRNSYFTFSFYNKTRGRIAYPEDLIKIFGGNGSFMGEGNHVDINGFGPFMVNYNEIALGLSKQLTHRLVVGGKVKVLMGNACVESRTSRIRLTTDNDLFNPVMTLETDFRFNSSLPVDYTYDEDGNVDGVEDIDDSDISSSIISTKNMGLGIDLGATYQLNDKIKLWASITDLGFIGWKNNTRSLSQDMTYRFPGFSLDSIWTESDYDEFEELADSIADQFTFSESDTKFTTWLPTNIYLGGTYELIPEVNFGLLSRTFFYDRKLHQAVTLSANFKPVKWFNTTVSYSMMNREYKNIGLGFGIKGGPVQFYLVTDYLSAAFWHKNAKTVGAQFGFNLYFGCGKRENYSMIKNKKPQKDIDFM